MPARSHGHKAKGKPTPTYTSWQNMRRRCSDASAPNYCDYGGRGIVVCERWSSFANFLADMGVCPAGLTLDRKDNNLGYNLANCRWATTKAQARNRRSTKLTVESVAQIKQLLELGYGPSGIARMFNVSPDSITLIKKGKTWQSE